MARLTLTHSALVMLLPLCADCADVDRPDVAEPGRPGTGIAHAAENPGARGRDSVAWGTDAAGPSGAADAPVGEDAASDGAVTGRAPAPAFGGEVGVGGGSGVGTGRGTGEGVSGATGLGAGGVGRGTGNLPISPPGGLSGIGGTDVGTGRETAGIPGAAGLGAAGSGTPGYGTSGPSGEAASVPVVSDRTCGPAERIVIELLGSSDSLPSAF